MKILKTTLVVLLSSLLFVAGALKHGYNVGDVVKDFELKGVSGDMISLSDYDEAKGFILIFDCNTCPFSQAYLERIKSLHAKYKDKGYPVVAIQSNDPKKSPGDSFEKMVSYAQANSYEHAYLYDADQTIAKQFGATNTPHVYVIEKQGRKMVVEYIGTIDNNAKNPGAADKNYVEDAVDALLRGDKPEVTKTKAIGCTIKWS